MSHRSRNTGRGGAAIAAVPSPAPEVHSLGDLRFDRALADLNDTDPRARVALDTKTGLAHGVDGTFQMTMPAAARALPGSDRAAAASVLFLDRFGGLFGIAGWHVLSPLSASPLGRSVWFAFEAKTAAGIVTAHVCADEDTVKHVRIEH